MDVHMDTIVTETMSGKNIKKTSFAVEPFVSRFERYVLYETAGHFYLIGSDNSETKFKIVKLDRQLYRPNSLADILTEENNEYSKREITDMLEMIDEGCKSTGGLKRLLVAFGIVGFIKFLDCFYLTLITQRKKVGKIGPNFIYAVKAVEVVPIKPKEKSEKNPFMKLWVGMNKSINRTATDSSELKYMGYYSAIDITKDFFYSYTYDLTNCFQHNFVMAQSKAFPPPPSQEMFEWNHYQVALFE